MRDAWQKMSTRRRMLFVALVLLVLPKGTTATWAGFSAAATNGANGLGTGTVVVSDDIDGSASLFDLSGMLPEATATKCINVSFAGSLDSVLKLYATATGTSLATYLDLTIERSTGAAGGSTGSCTGFDSGSAVTLWSSANGTLADFLAAKTSFAAGVDSWAVTGGGATDTASYRFTVTLQDDDNAQNKTSVVTLVWEAQNT